MANTRDLLNKVLRGLRQFDLIITGTSTTDTYILMLLQFVNEAKEEVEESGWAWQALRQTITLTLSSATSVYAITAAGPADIDTNDRSRLLYENVSSGSRSEGFYSTSSSLPMVFDVTTGTEVRLQERTQEAIERLHFTDNDQTGKPVYFTLYSDGTSLIMRVWPTSDGTYTLKLRIFDPQDELSASVLTTSLLLPSRPVWTRALFKANEERGSELGKQGSSLYLAMLDAHGVAVGKEQTPADQTVHLEK